MLLDLHVINMALIHEAEVEFGPGLNILTGETGAGKSIVIGSVNVALGTGSFKDYVSEGAEYALVELVFQSDRDSVRQKMADLGIPMEDDQIIISRKYQKGRSISRINGETVHVSTIRELARDLIDIHGQHEHQSLLYPQFHLKLLDQYAKAALGNRKEQCEAAYHAWRQVSRELQQALDEAGDREKQIDFLMFEINEIEEAHPVPGEDEILERDFTRMSHSQKIQSALAQVMQLTGSDEGAMESIGRAVRVLGGVAHLDPLLETLFGRLSELENLAGDFRYELSDSMDEFGYDEQEYDRMGRRLDLLNHLKAKYGRTLEEVLAYQKEKQQRLDQLTDFEQYLDQLRQKQKCCEEELKRIAREISVIRRSFAEELSKQIRASLTDLNFNDVRFTIDFQEKSIPDQTGMDEICFMLSTNPGLPERPLQDVASGGELSRIMLAIKAVMADQDEIGTLIFDEIDTGISGRTAQRVSEKMAVIADGHQVICITHLAQIAAMADTHMEIEKHVRDGITETDIRILSEEEQIGELARILGGAELTDTVYQSAREMKTLAEKIRSRQKMV